MKKINHPYWLLNRLLSKTQLGLLSDYINATYNLIHWIWGFLLTYSFTGLGY